MAGYETARQARWRVLSRQRSPQLALAPELQELEPEWTPDDWATPPAFIEELEREFGPFQLDPCATARNAKAPRYFTRAEDGLSRPWDAQRVFCNPPYSSARQWLEKARVEALNGALVVCLIPSRTEMSWFHDLVLPHAEVRFIRGHQYFIGPDGKRGHPVWAVMLAIYRPAAPSKAD